MPSEGVNIIQIDSRVYVESRSTRNRLMASEKIFS